MKVKANTLAVIGIACLLTFPSGVKIQQQTKKLTQ